MLWFTTLEGEASESQRTVAAGGLDGDGRVDVCWLWADCCAALPWNLVGGVYEAAISLYMLAMRCFTGTRSGPETGPRSSSLPKMEPHSSASLMIA